MSIRNFSAYGPLTGRVTYIRPAGDYQGRPVVNFGFALTTGQRLAELKDAAGNTVQAFVDTSDLMNVSAWDELAAAASTLVIGQEVTITPKSMKPHAFVDKNGKADASVDVNVCGLIPGAPPRNATNVQKSFAPRNAATFEPPAAPYAHPDSDFVDEAPF